MLLFAYASNMNVAEFAKKVPSAKKIANAKLHGYKFGFSLTADDGSSKASLETASADDVAWGVLIEFDDNEKDNFFLQDDRFEWTTVNCVDENGEMYHAHTFVTLPHAINSFILPYDWYQAKLIKAARGQGLPEDYITTLSLLPHKVDPDEKRRERKSGKS